MTLNNRFIEELSIEKKRAFAVVLLIKSKYTNSRVYDLSYDKMCKELCLSRYITRKYIGIIISNGWGHVTKDRELVIYSFKKIFGERQYKEYKIKVSKGDNVTDIVDKLNFILLKKNISNQDRAANFKGYEQHSREDCEKSKLSLKQYKTLKKVRDYNPELLHGVFVEHSVIGLRRLSEILKCSIGNASRFLKKMVANGLIKIKEVIEKVADNISSFNNNYAQGDFGYYFVFERSLYRHLGTHIILNQ